MPTYQYKCSNCEKVFDFFQKMTDKPLEACILCEKKGKVKRIIGAGAGLIFKGSGFYETDYKRKEKKIESKDSSSSSNSSSSEKTPATKTESKKINSKSNE